MIKEGFNGGEVIKPIYKRNLVGHTCRQIETYPFACFWIIVIHLKFSIIFVNYDAFQVFSCQSLNHSLQKEAVHCGFTRSIVPDYSCERPNACSPKVFWELLCGRGYCQLRLIGIVRIAVSMVECDVHIMQTFVFVDVYIANM